jgi:hypothetical protein
MFPDTIPTFPNVPIICFTFNHFLDPVTNLCNFDDGSQRISFFRLDNLHRNGGLANSEAKHRNSLSEVPPEDDGSFLDAVDAEIDDPVSGPPKPLSMVDFRPGMLGFWKILLEEGLSDSVVEKLVDFMCGELKNVDCKETLLVEILGYDEKNEAMWGTHVQYEVVRQCAQLDGTVRTYTRFIHDEAIWERNGELKAWSAALKL